MENAKTEYTIKRMESQHMQTIIDLMQAEGWNPGIYDAQTFYAADPDGFFMGCLGDEIICTASAVIYDDNFAFFGCYIVKPEYRDQGYGFQVTQARLEYVGDRNLGLDGVLDMSSKYTNIGFQTAYETTRYHAKPHLDTISHPQIADAKNILFADVVEYDAQYFPAKRAMFLRHWINQPECTALVYLKHNKIHGFGVIRKCIKGYKIGPLFAENADIADILYRQLAGNTYGAIIYIDIPHPNKSAEALIKKYNMERDFTEARMYTKGNPDIDLSKVYGITTYELG